MAPPSKDGVLPEGVGSVLDTDLYKLTMQNAVLKYFPDVEVTYKYTNRTADLRLNRQAFEWLKIQTARLATVRVTEEEIVYLTEKCKFFTSDYIAFLKAFSFKPDTQVHITFESKEQGSEEGQVAIAIKGKWVDTILYEIPLLALVSEAYFKFSDTDWDHEGQEARAYEKGLKLLRAGCNFSEFGSRRRRDYQTQHLVLRGLTRASKDAAAQQYPGKLMGTSNVHFAHKFGLAPIGTVAHEWFMGIAAVTNDYKSANELGLRYWVGTFGRGQLAIALTDTFGTPDFLKAFAKPAPVDFTTELPESGDRPSYAQVFTGIRQDSGDPAEYAKLLKQFYVSHGINDRKTVVFSDSLNVERCIEYKRVSDEVGLTPSFGVGTFLTNDFTSKSTGGKSVPLNIVIKISEAAGRPAVKISDNLGKNTGDSAEVARVKRELGYVEHDWVGGDETKRWGERGEKAGSS